MNAFIETRAPWKLAKSTDPQDKARLDSCLAYVAEGLRLVGTLLLPVMPESASKLLLNIGQTVPTHFEGELNWSTVCTGKKVSEKCILFPPIEDSAPGVKA
jgi:methionyl-tRNA synthetase